MMAEAGPESSVRGPEPNVPAQVRKSGVVVPHKAKWYQRLAAWLIWLLIRSVSATMARNSRRCASR